MRRQHYRKNDCLRPLLEPYELASIQYCLARPLAAVHTRWLRKVQIRKHLRQAPCWRYRSGTSSQDPEQIPAFARSVSAPGISLSSRCLRFRSDLCPGVRMPRAPRFRLPSDWQYRKKAACEEGIPSLRCLATDMIPILEDPSRLVRSAWSLQ